MASAWRCFYILPFVALLLTGCGILGEGDRTPPKTEWEKERERIGSLAGDDGFIIFGGKRDKESQGGENGIGVNAFLWRASLDTISFMPLTSVDPFGGVILTDWFIDTATPGERSKINVFIYGKELRSDALKVTVFKQIQNGSGWRDIPVNAVVGRTLEETILTRARQLKIESLSE